MTLVVGIGTQKEGRAPACNTVTNPEVHETDDRRVKHL